LEVSFWQAQRAKMLSKTKKSSYLRPQKLFAGILPFFLLEVVLTKFKNSIRYRVVLFRLATQH